jgi:hypothetical protein
MLRMKPEWRFESPRTIPSEVVGTFRTFIDQISAQQPGQSMLEHFKRYFSAAAGMPHHRSSDASWASSDLDRYMELSAENAPTFIDAFSSACEALKQTNPDIAVPSVGMVNRVLSKHRAGYEINGDEIVETSSTEPILISSEPLSVEDQARAAINEAIAASDRALAEGNGRQAVQELLWVLETVATAFRGVETPTGTVQGKYFNEIVRELRSGKRKKHQEQFFQSMLVLHGYLSSPTGGGVRHGSDLKEGVALELSEARLCCNLIRSYINYLIAEHERLGGTPSA